MLSPGRGFVVAALLLLTGAAAHQKDVKCDFCTCQLFSESSEIVSPDSSVAILNCSGTARGREQDSVRLPPASSYGIYSENYTNIWAEFKRNSISVVQTLDLTFINILYLDENKIEVIHDNAFDSISRTLKELHLSHNWIKELRSKMFYTLTKLEVLDLSHNRFTVLDFDHFNFNGKLKVITLSHNEITSIKHSSNNVGLLEKLDLASNKIAQLDAKVFPSMSSFKFLDLSNNTITSVHSEAFKSLAGLSSLDLSHNNLSALTHDRLHSVKILRLGYNNVADLRSIMHTFPNVEELHVEKNGLFKLDGSVNFGKVKVLNLSVNNLTEFPAKLYPNVTVLDLSWNVLATVPAGLTGELLPRLKRLSLDGNPVENLQFPQHRDDRQQTRFQQLQWLSVSHMPNLATLSATALKNVVVKRANPNTETAEWDDNPCGGGLSLVAAYNPRLASVEEGALDGISFCEVDLSYNELRSLPKDLLVWTTVPYVNLQGNPWDCQCANSWLLDVVPHLYKTGRVQMLFELRCASPPRYRDRRIVHFYNWTQNAFCAEMGSYMIDPQNNADSINVNMSSSEGMFIAIGVLGSIFVVLVVVGLVYQFRFTKARRLRNRRF